jgi:glycosyltransferase involved in cell wall biosynthesis
MSSEISIIIPTFNNLNYLKLCLESIKKNSSYKHTIMLHINDGSDGTLSYVKINNFPYTHSNTNIGLCSAINKIASKVETKYLLYAHDDMYFCPKWDEKLLNEVNSINHSEFYLSGTMIEQNSAHISFDCGSTPNNFDEKKLLLNFSNLHYYDHQGSHFAPHLVEKKIWDKVGGFSEEFNPGMSSDPDFNMKLWREGVRIFKGINNFRVYHFSSTTTRKKTDVKRNRGDITFLKKWGITTKFFKKYYLKSRTKYYGPLKDPSKNIIYFFGLLKCKIKLFYLNLNL